MVYESKSTDSDLDAPTMKRIDVQPVIEQIGGIIIDGSPRLMIASEQSLQAVKNKKWKEKEVQSEDKSPLKGKSPMEKNVAVTTPNSDYLVPDEYITFPETMSSMELMRRYGIEPMVDPSPWETRGTQLMVTRGTCYQPDHHYPDHHHPDSPKDMHGAAILSGTPPRKGKRRFSFSYPRKSKRRWQSVDTRIVSTNTSG
uniref:Uncharacterized protein n=1 Tax=Vitis vinifera TaxID=29760 RepID=A5BDA9_VITVI|nr:hypothetical protein VITISV_004476 [Vitis vinifera]